MYRRVYLPLVTTQISRVTRSIPDVITWRVWGRLCRAGVDGRA